MFPSHLQWSSLKSILLTTRVSQLAFFLSDKGLPEAVGGLVELNEFERDNKLVEAEFLRVHGMNKRHYHVHHVWCLDPVNTKDFVARIQDYQARTCRWNAFCPMTNYLWAARIPWCQRQCSNKFRLLSLILCHFWIFVLGRVTTSSWWIFFRICFQKNLLCAAPHCTASLLETMKNEFHHSVCF